MKDRPSSSVGRRQLLTATAAVAGATGIAGCSSVLDRGGVSDSGATDVIVHNIASEAKTVSITITDDGEEEPHTDRTLDVPSGGTVDPVNASKLPTNTSKYTVAVTVEDGPSETFEWTEPTVTLAPLWVQIDGSRNIVFLLQAG